MKGIPALRTAMRAIQRISWLMIITAVILTVIAQFEGEKPEPWPLFTLIMFGGMFAGIIGVFSHSVLTSMDKRITKIEDSQRVTGEPEAGGDS